MLLAKKIIVPLLALTVLTSFGCGSGKIKTIPVTGTITLDGSPLADAMVAFVPDSETEGTQASGRTDSSGKYTIKPVTAEADPGTTAGKYKVTVRKTEMVSTGQTITNTDDDGNTEKVKDMRAVETLNKLYTSRTTTPFEAEVVAGKENVFDFDLKSKP